MSTESVYTISSPFESIELSYIQKYCWVTFRLCWYILRQMFLTLIDEYSKMIQVHKTATPMSTVVNQELRTTIARFSLLETIVTDMAYFCQFRV